MFPSVSLSAEAFCGPKGSSWARYGKVGDDLELSTRSRNPQALVEPHHAAARVVRRCGMSNGCLQTRPAPCFRSDLASATGCQDDRRGPKARWEDRRAIYSFHGFNLLALKPFRVEDKPISKDDGHV